MNNNPIGVFDSGIGGLTVLKELRRSFPNENFIYLGDTARVPYGTKSKKTVTRYAIQIIDFLLQRKVKLIVVACNTVSSNSLDNLRKYYRVPLIGVIEPGVKMALIHTENRRVGVIGTKATIGSDMYKRLLLQKDKNIKVFSKPCPLFVPLVEEGWFNNKISLEIAHKYLDDLKRKKIDTLILGCTHYPMLIPVIKKVLNNTFLINSGKAVAEEVRNILNSNKLSADKKRIGKTVFYFTDLTPLVITLGEKILDEKIKNIKNISLE